MPILILIIFIVCQSWILANLGFGSVCVCRLSVCVSVVTGKNSITSGGILKLLWSSCEFLKLNAPFIVFVFTDALKPRPIDPVINLVCLLGSGRPGDCKSVCFTCDHPSERSISCQYGRLHLPFELPVVFTFFPFGTFQTRTLQMRCDFVGSGLSQFRLILLFSCVALKLPKHLCLLD